MSPAQRLGANEQCWYEAECGACGYETLFASAEPVEPGDTREGWCEFCGQPRRHVATEVVLDADE